jgi:hypothetical protein
MKKTAAITAVRRRAGLSPRAAARAGSRCSRRRAVFRAGPENWAGMGGRSARQLRAFTERYPFVCHGLSLSVGGQRPSIPICSCAPATSWLRTASACTPNICRGATTPASSTTCCPALHRRGGALGGGPHPPGPGPARLPHRHRKRLPLRHPPGAEMDEASFIRAVVDEADCLLHLDVNNILVNARNFGFDPFDFLHALPLTRTCYIHVAGHHVEDDGLLIDTHGAAGHRPGVGSAGRGLSPHRPGAHLPGAGLRLSAPGRAGRRRWPASPACRLAGAAR